jgi:hypothetical protein
VIRALSLGNSTPGGIASYISGFIERGLRSQDVKSYLANLLRMGIADITQLADRKRYLYSIESPLIRGSISTHSPGYRIDGESGSLLRSNILFE